MELLMVAMMTAMLGMMGYRYYLMYDLGRQKYNDPTQYISYHQASWFEQVIIS